MLLKRSRLLLVLFLLVSALAVAAADEPPAQPIGKTLLTCAPTIGALDVGPFLQGYDKRDQWKATPKGIREKSTQDALGELVGRLTCSAEGGKLVFTNDDVFTFLFFDGDRARRVTYQGRYTPDYHGLRLVGRRLFDIRLCFHAAEECPNSNIFSVSTEYSGSPVPNPLIGGISGLLKTFIGAYSKSTLFLPVGLDGGPVLGSVQAYRVDVPDELARANITIQDYLPTSVSTEVTESEDRTIVRESAKKETTTTKGMSSTKSSTVEKDRKVDTEKNTVIEKSKTVEKATKPGPEKDTVIENEKTTLTQKSTKTVSSASPQTSDKGKGSLILTGKYLYAPATRVEVGLGAGLNLGTSLNIPAKVDASKNLVDDTPTTPVTYVAFNWRPWGYDESTLKPSFGEAARIVIGPTLTPNPGVAVGVGLSPFWWPSLRPFSIQGGYAVMLANVLRSNDVLGAPPTDRDRQTKRGALGALFLGIGYGLN